MRFNIALGTESPLLIHRIVERRYFQSHGGIQFHLHETVKMKSALCPGATFSVVLVVPTHWGLVFHCVGTPSISITGFSQLGQFQAMAPIGVDTPFCARSIVYSCETTSGLFILTTIS